MICSAAAHSPTRKPLARIRAQATIATCAVQVGVSERALEITSAYVRERMQFGVPIGSFQAVQHRLADAYIDVESMRWVMWRAAWKLSRNEDATREVAVAKFWAAEAGARVAASAQHLHGGIGVDVDYPIHRYFLWSKALELSFGNATEQLVALGRHMAAKRTDAVMILETRSTMKSHDRDGEAVASLRAQASARAAQRAELLEHGGSQQPLRPHRSATSKQRSNMSTKTMRFEQVNVGTELPPLAIPITTTLVVAGALASRDFTPVHHDKAAAQAQGMQDVFMNILTTNGLVGRYVTDWAGPDAVVRERRDQARRAQPARRHHEDDRQGRGEGRQRAASSTSRSSARTVGAIT